MAAVLVSAAMRMKSPRNTSAIILFALSLLLVMALSCTTTTNNNCPEPDGGIPDAGPGGGEPDGGTPPELDDMTAAFLNYLEVTRDITLELRESSSFGPDPVGMIDIMTGMMIANLRNSMGSSAGGFRGRPRWGAFDNPNVRLGVDNPDTRYLAANIENTSDDNIYRVWGNRGNTVDWILLSLDSTNPMGGGGTIEDEDLVNLDGDPLQPNEDFEVCVSTAEQYDDTYMDNWLEIPSSEELAIHSRYTVCNYATQRPADIFIERMGTEGVAITAEEYRAPEVMIKQIEQGTAVMENQQPFWGTFSSLITGLADVNEMTHPHRHQQGRPRGSQLDGHHGIRNRVPRRSSAEHRPGRARQPHRRSARPTDTAREAERPSEHPAGRHRIGDPARACPADRHPAALPARKIRSLVS